MNNNIVKMFWRKGTYVKVTPKYGDPRYGVIVTGTRTGFGDYGIAEYKNGMTGKVYSVHASSLTELTPAEYFAALLKGEQHAN